MSIRTSTILVAVVIVAAACGGSGNGGTQASGTTGATSPSSPSTASPTTPPAQGSGSGACARVTQDEAATALGSQVPAGIDTTAALPVQGAGSIDAQYCSYGSEVLVARFDLGSAGAALFAAYKQSLSSESDFKEVSGVGDEAFFAKGQLAVRQGGTGLIIDVGQNTGSVTGEQEKEQGLAMIALGRL